MIGVVGADPRVGTELAGYRIEAVLGRGGMGVVYLAQDPWLERRVALKLVAPELSEDERFRKRFLTESRLAASLEHANVVPIYEAGETDGLLYIAMRYVEGSDLKTLLEAEGRLEPDRALAIVERVAVALDAAHSRGLVHRDVKPGNILVAFDRGRGPPPSVYLSDFGLTKHARDLTELTSTSELLGTLDYVAPEQIEGAALDGRTDQYSLGCVLYQCLTGEVPFPRDSTMTLLWAHLEEEPPRPSEHVHDLPQALDGVIATALAKSPDDRYSSCEELVAAAWKALEVPAPTIPAPLVHARNPYKGLRPFGELDADDFFGREALVEQLLERLSDPAGGRFLAVVGASGSGKSSVVRAGLIPRLRQGALPGSEGWRIVEMLPGARPLEELDAALALPPTEAAGPCDGGDCLLLVDQFEELFTMVEEEAVRRQFLGLLRSAVSDPRSRLRVIVTLRADFYDRPLRYHEFSHLFEDGLVTVHPLSPEELERAIAGPAEGVGIALEPGLVADIVADVVDQPGALPLLQYALTELFERRESGTLTTKAYRQIGGVSGALVRRAEDLYAELEADGQEAARKLFTRLVTLGEGTEDTRRRGLRQEISAIESSERAIEKVIDIYGRHRLLSFDRDPLTQSPTVEIAHEALLREWPRLRAWIDDDRAGLRLLRHLSEAASAWQKRGRDPGELYRGGRLEAALAWAEAHPVDLNPLERGFLAASRDQREGEERAERDRVLQQARQNRRLRIALAVIAIALVGAIVAGVLALQQRNRANDERFAAENGRLVAESTSLLPRNRRLALLLAAEAHRRDPSVQSLGALQRALTGTEGFLGYLGEGSGYRAVAFSSDGKRVAAVSDTAIEVYDLPQSRLERRIELAEAPSESALSQSGELAAIATADGRLRLYDVASGTERGDLSPHAEPATALAFSPDLRRLAFGDAGGTVVLLDLSSRTLSRELKAHSDAIKELRFSRDGSLLATTPTSTPGAPAHAMVVRLWDVRSGAQVGKELVPPNRPGHEGWGATALDFGPDGTLLASGRLALRRWDVRTGEILGDIRHPRLSERVDPTQEFAILDVSLVTRSRAALSTGARVTIVDLITGKAIGAPLDTELTVPYEDSSLQNLAVSRDGSTLAVWGNDGISLWSLDGRQLLARALPRGDAAYAMANADGSRLIASPTFRSPPIAWDMTVDPPTRFPFIDEPALVGFPDNGKVLMTNPTQGETTGIQPIRLWDPIALTLIASLPPEEVAYGLEANREAGLFAIGQAPLVKVFDIDTGRLVAELDHFAQFKEGNATPFVSNLGFTPDGQRLVGTTDRGHAIVWNTSTWEPVGEPLSAEEGAVAFAMYSPDGRYLMTSDAAGTIVLRDSKTYEPVGNPLVGHRRTVATSGAFFSPNGTRLVTFALDGQTLLWDVPSRTRIGESFPGENGSGTPGGRLLITMLGEHMLLWDMDTDRWAETACRAAGRNMTPAEWDEFGPADESYRATCEQWPIVGD